MRKNKTEFEYLQEDAFDYNIEILEERHEKDRDWKAISALFFALHQQIGNRKRFVRLINKLSPETADDISLFASRIGETGFAATVKELRTFNDNELV